MEIALRVFLEVADREQGQRIADELARLLAALAKLRSSKVEQYWKIPEYFEALLVFEVRSCTGAVLDAATSTLGTGWELQGPREAIWNHGEGCIFRAEEARWAQIELME